LNQLWDRSDALLDYAWKESQNQAELQFRIAAQKEQAQLDRDKINAASKGGGFGSVVGAIAGTALGSLAGGIGGEVGGMAGKKVGAALFGP
jgi:phage tail tape-measure protein